MVNRYLGAVTANLTTWVVNTVFFLIITPLAIHTMGEEFFGLWTILNSILLFSTVGTMGISVVVNKFGSQEGKEQLDPCAIISTAIAIITPLALSFALSLVFLRGMIANLLSLSVSYRSQFSTALIFTAISLIPQFLSQVFQGYLFSKLRYDLVKWVSTFSNIALWIGAVIIVVNRKDLVPIALWGLIVQIITCSILYHLVSKRVAFHWKWDARIMSQMGQFSIFTFIESLAVSMYQNLDRILVGFVIGPAAAGIYSVGTSIGLRLSIITGQITEVLVPFSSRKNSLNDRDSLYKVFLQVSRIVNVLLMTISSLLILWMREILHYWISPIYAENNSHIFRILVLAYILLSACRPGHQTLTGIGKVRWTSIIYFSSTVVMVCGLYVGSSRWGLEGAAIANFSMALLLIYNLLTHRFLHNRINWKRLFEGLSLITIIPLTAFVLTEIYSILICWKIIFSLIILLFDLCIIWLDAELRGQVTSRLLQMRDRL